MPTVIGAAVLGFLLSKQFLTDWNPEFLFWRDCVNQKRSELDILAGQHKSVVIFAGGSTCAFSIDPVVLADEVAIPTYNLGGAVPMGARYLVSMAINAARSGDVLVLALEPVFLTTSEGAEEKALGISLAFDDSKNGIQELDLSWEDLLLRRRPGAQFMATFWGKKIMGLPGYRYSMSDFRGGGRLTTDFRAGRQKPVGALPPQKLSEEGVALLEDIIKRAQEKNVQLLYTMPWTYTHPEVADQNRAVNQNLLRQIEGFLPLIEDPFVGVHTEETFFADAPNHLTDEGASARSRAIGPSLKKWITSP